MSLWDKTNTPPKNLTQAEKRNVIITDQGFVRRRVYTDQNSRTRTKDEILVSIGGLANSTNWKFARITDAWSGNTTVTHGGTVNVWVSFSEPLSSSGLSGRIKMTVSNTASGNAMLATSSGTVYDGNKLVFRFKPSLGGTYKVNAHLMANGSSTAVNTRSTNSGTELANLYFFASVSNNLGSFTVYGQPAPKLMKHSSNGVTGSTFVNTWIVFTDPISVTSSLAARFRISVANTQGGNNMFAYANNTVYGGNRLLFRWKPTVNGNYKVQAQTIANTATMTIVHTTTNEAASKVISGTVSNTATPSTRVVKS